MNIVIYYLDEESERGQQHSYLPLENGCGYLVVLNRVMRYLLQQYEISIPKNIHSMIIWCHKEHELKYLLEAYCHDPIKTLKEIEKALLNKDRKKALKALAISYGL